MKNNPKTIYILIGVFCVLAIIAGIYAQFFVSDAADKFKQFANSILPYDIETTKQIQIEEF